MAGIGAALLCCLLVAAAAGPRLCWGVKVLKGLKGYSVFFPALHFAPADTVRVTWRSQGTHIAEAKPREKIFIPHYLPDFRGRLFIHPTNLSLEIRALKLEDSGRYKVVVDTFSDPTNPKTFSYFLLVCGDAARTGDMGRPSGSTVGPWGTPEPCAGDAGTWHEGGGQPLEGGRGPGRCGAQDRYCLVKGYLLAAVFGPLLMLVVAVHVVTRDKATEAGG